MNIAAGLELAYATLLRARAELGPSVAVRCFQTLADDAEGLDSDVRFPLLDIRANPPGWDENGHTCHCDVSILCATHGDDDKRRAQLRELYGAVEAALIELYDDSQRDGEAWGNFLGAAFAELGTSISVGGLSWPGGIPPTERDGINVIGQTMRVHFARQ